MTMVNTIPKGLVTVAVLLASSLLFIHLLHDNDSYRHQRRQLRVLFTSSDPKTIETKPPFEEIENENTFPSSIVAGSNNRPLIHVFNPFHSHEESSFSPLNHEQWSMLASIRRAKENYIQHQLLESSNGGNNEVIKSSFDHVIIVCAILEMDAEILQTVLPSYCDRIHLLPRNTAEAYPRLQLKQLPFVQDIVDTGMNVGREVMLDESDYYLMLTNSDICLTDHFYTNLNENWISSASKAVTINRMTVPMSEMPDIPAADNRDLSLDGIHDAAMNILEQAKSVYENDKFGDHPGIDCFIAHSSVWDKAQFGDLFLGHPPFDWHIKLAFEIMEPSYKEIHSNKQGTFHLGDERAWTHGGEHNIGDAFDRPAEEIIMLLEWCPRLLNGLTDRYSLQNGINCGELFHPPGPNMVPAFVRPGYEGEYEQAFQRPKRGPKLGKAGKIGDYQGVFPACGIKKHKKKDKWVCVKFGSIFARSKGLKEILASDVLA